MLDVVNVSPPVAAARVCALPPCFVDEQFLKRGFDLSLMLSHGVQNTIMVI
jgi:hypothetical protein